jgi:protease-4
MAAGPMPPMMGGMAPPPPMMMMPPPMFGPPPRRGGIGRTLFMIFIILLLAVSVLVNLLLLGGSAMGEGSVVHETVKKGSSEASIAIVPINGIIDENMSRQFDNFMNQAEKDKDIKAIIVEIDSPGGTVTASDEIYARILKYKQDKKIPIVVSMGSLATSGGYYAACAADHIFAQQTTLTGNIGVLMPRFNVHKLMEKWGVEENTIVSEGAKYKNAGSMFSLETPEQTKYLQGIADSMFARFKDVVKQGRGAKITAAGKKMDEVADGRAFTAAEAKTLGLVDTIGYLGDAISHAQSAASLSDPRVFRYHRPPTLFEALAARSNVSPAQALGGTTISGVNVNVDRKVIDELLTPHVLYLWRGD